MPFPQVDDVVFRQSPALADCFPGSTKTFKEVTHEATGEVLQVPFRRVALTNGATFDLYDTSGPQVGDTGALAHGTALQLPWPQGLDPRHGLPKLRESWVSRRDTKGDKTPTQMYYARQVRRQRLSHNANADTRRPFSLILLR